MGWHLVQKLLEQSAEHSTLVGKFWVTSFFIIRLLIVTAMAGSVWGDAQGNFVCNTLSPGCKNVCFNEFSPIAVSRYWLLQILCVSLPSIIFIVYTAHKMAKVKIVVAARKKHMKAQNEKKKEVKAKQKELDKQRMIEAGGDPNEVDELLKGDSDDEDEKPKDENIVATKLSDDAPSKLFLAYFSVVFMRLLVEIGFMVGQYYLYTFKFLMPELFQCQHWPCPNVVDCFVSRPMEKSIFICLFFATGCVMIILNVLELYHIAGNFPKAWKERHDDITKHADEGPSFGHAPSRMWAPGAHYVEAGLDGYPDAVGIPMLIETRPDVGRQRGRRMRVRKY